MATATQSAERAVDEYVKKLKGRMKETGITPTELARKAKIGRPYLYRVLSGEQIPSLDWAAKVGRHVGLKIQTIEV
jgi:DNA-binding phage protein